MSNKKVKKTGILKGVLMFVLVLVMTGVCACGSTEEQEKEATVTEDAEGETAATPVEFEEVVVVDNEECSVKITGLDPDNIWGYTLKAELENK